jgi:DNA-binding SARP family transcriptional activator
VHLRLMGGFELSTAGRAQRPNHVGEQILALLALRGQHVSRTHVAGILWPDHVEQKAAGSLRTALWRLKAVRGDLITCDQFTLSLGTDVHVDAHDLLAQAQRLMRCAPGEAPDGFEMELFARDLLPDWYDEWVVLERERLRLLRLTSLERLALRMLECGDYVGAIHAGTAVVESEPLRESAQRVLIRAHISNGNYSDAIGLYQSYGRLLDHELGLQPSPLMDELVSPILRC